MIIIIIGTLSESENDFINDLFQEHHVRFYNISHSILHSHADAEDAVSQAFLRMLSYVERISRLPEDQILPYCIVIVKNEANNIINKQSSTTKLEETLIREGHELFEDPLVELFPEDEDIRRRLKAVVSDLPEADRMFINLRFSNKMSYKELAELWEVTEATARQRGSRIVKKLRVLCEEGRNI